MRYISTYSLFNESKSISNSCEKLFYEIKDEIVSKISKLEDGQKIQNLNFDDLKIDNLIISWEINVGNKNKCDGLTNINTSSIRLIIEYSDMDDEFLFYIESVL